MASPTPFYGWTIPAEGQDPWFDTLDDTLSAIDTAVHSVEVGLLSRATLAMSVYPAAQMIVSSATWITSGPDATWTVASVSPYGRCVGSFAIVTSGAKAFFDLRGSGFMGGVATATVFGAGTARFRLILHRPSVSSLIIPNNSSWVMDGDIAQAHLPFAPFTTLTSLGPGNYSVELQITFPHSNGSSSSVCSTFILDGNDFITLTVIETHQ